MRGSHAIFGLKVFGKALHSVETHGVSNFGNVHLRIIKQLLTALQPYDADKVGRTFARYRLYFAPKRNAVHPHRSGKRFNGEVGILQIILHNGHCPADKLFV